MQIDAPSAQNVSPRLVQPSRLFYPENTALVDFVAKYFSLSDERQAFGDERPRQQIHSQTLAHEH
jgi:hypothetical protein